MLNPVTGSNYSEMPLVEVDPPHAESIGLQEPAHVGRETPRQISLCDSVVESQLRTIERLTKENEKAFEEIAKRQVKINETEAYTLALEERIAILERQLQLEENPHLTINPVENQEPVSFWGSLWQGTKNAFSSVGSFCYRNRQLIRAGASLTGVILCCVFPPSAFGIFLGVGTFMAAFEWYSSFYK